MLLSDQVFGFADAALRRNEDARLAEESRRKYRDRDERRLVARDRHGVGGQRHLGDVEFAVAQHAKERLLDMQVKAVEIDAFGAHAAVGKRASAIVVPAGQGQPQFRHVDPPMNGNDTGLTRRTRRAPARRARAAWRGIIARCASPSERLLHAQRAQLVLRKVHEHRQQRSPRGSDVGRRHAAHRDAVDGLGQRHELALERSSPGGEKNVHLAPVARRADGARYSRWLPSPSARQTWSAPSRPPRGSARAASGRRAPTECAGMSSGRTDTPCLASRVCSERTSARVASLTRCAIRSLGTASRQCLSRRCVSPSEASLRCAAGAAVPGGECVPARFSFVAVSVEVGAARLVAQDGTPTWCASVTSRCSRADCSMARHTSSVAIAHLPSCRRRASVRRSRHRARR